MRIRRSLLKDKVTVSTYTGDGAHGPIFAPPVTVLCNIDETRRLVRDTNGDEVVSEATLILHPRTRTAPAPGLTQRTVDPSTVFTAESPVTIRGRDTKVVATKTHTVRGTPAMVEVTCA